MHPGDNKNQIFSKADVEKLKEKFVKDGRKYMENGEEELEYTVKNWREFVRYSAQS